MASKKRVLKLARAGVLSLPAGHPFAAAVELPTPAVTPTVTLEAPKAVTPTVTLEAPKAVTPTPVKKKSTRKKKSVKK